MAPQSYSIADAISHKENVKKKLAEYNRKYSRPRRELNNAKGEISATVEKPNHTKLTNKNKEAVFVKMKSPPLFFLNKHTEKKKN
jgi:hypothetical protein